jgi:hypothetical protein
MAKTKRPALPASPIVIPASLVDTGIAYVRATKAKAKRKPKGRAK